MQLCIISSDTEREEKSRTLRLVFKALSKLADLFNISFSDISLNSNFWNGMTSLSELVLYEQI